MTCERIFAWGCLALLAGFVIVFPLSVGPCDCDHTASIEVSELNKLNEQNTMWLGVLEQKVERLERRIGRDRDRDWGSTGSQDPTSSVLVEPAE